MHVNDPEEFWDESKLNPYAKAEGWFYGPETINNEEQYRQIDVVLSRHPQLHLQLAHMYFLSAQLQRLSRLLRSYPQVRVDLTPGIELYTNLSRNIKNSRAFFAEFSERILYGSDIGSRSCIAEPPKAIDPIESTARVRIIRTFLESNGSYLLEPDGHYLFNIEPTQMNGLGLSEEMLNKIYEENARAFYGGKPAKVDPSLLEQLIKDFDKGISQLDPV